MLVELHGRGSGSGEEVCVYVCERVHVRARERGGGGGGQRVQVGCVPTHCLCAGLDNECVISFRLWTGEKMQWQHGQGIWERKMVTLSHVLT